MAATGNKGDIRRMSKSDEYYTPPEVYEAIKEWAVRKFDIQEGTEIIRPFYPGKDYKKTDYPNGCVVIDNPPFSILKEICEYYDAHNIRYVLFAPALMALKSYICGVCYIGEMISYDGADERISTAFIHNFYHAIETAPELDRAIKEINNRNRKVLPKYVYPDEVITGAMMRTLSVAGVHYEVRQWQRIRGLDSQKKAGKSIYGGGVIVSESKGKEARRKLQEAREERERNQIEPVIWELSEREKEIIRSLEEEEKNGNRVPESSEYKNK